MLQISKLKNVETIYQKKTIKIKATNHNKIPIRSKRIKINNGGLQGDIFAPTLFIIALDSILRTLPKPKERKTQIACAGDVAFMHHNAKDCKNTLQKNWTPTGVSKHKEHDSYYDTTEKYLGRRSN